MPEGSEGGNGLKLQKGNPVQKKLNKQPKPTQHKNF